MIKFFCFFLVLLVTSCSSNINDMICHINGDVDYLKTDSLCEIIAPNDLKLPLVNDKYKIPSIIERDGLHVGKKINICPPIVVY